jgi:hypothetical protein
VLNILLPLIYTLILLIIIWRNSFFRLDGLPKWTAACVFLLKIAAGTVLWYIYTYYYTERNNADIWKYFDDSLILFSALKESPLDYLRMLTGIDDEDMHITQTYYQRMDFWYQQFDSPFFNDGRTLIRFNALIRLFSFGEFHVHTVLINFISLIGLCWIWRIVKKAIGGRGWLAACIVFGLPSVLFWGSGVLKEGLLWFGIGGLLWMIMGSNKQIWIRIVLGFAFAAIIGLTRLYILVALLPALIVWLLVNYKILRPWLSFVTAMTCVTLIFLVLHATTIRTDPIKMIALKRNDFINLARGGTYLHDYKRVVHLTADHRDDLIQLSDSTARIRKGSNFRYWTANTDFMDTVWVVNYSDTVTWTILSDLPPANTLINIHYLKPTLSNFITYAPKALMDCTLRPFPWESQHLPLLPSALETTLLLVLCIVSAIRYQKSPDQAFTLFSLVLVVLLFMITGFTTPVLGAMVRYKAIGLVFLIAIIVQHIRLIRK